MTSRKDVPSAALHILAGPAAAVKAVVTDLLATRPEGEVWAVLINDVGLLEANALSGVVWRELFGGCACCAAASSPLLRTAVAQLLKPSGGSRPKRLLLVLSANADPSRLLPMLAQYFGCAAPLRSILLCTDPATHAAAALAPDAASPPPPPSPYKQQYEAADVVIGLHGDGVLDAGDELNAANDGGGSWAGSWTARSLPGVSKSCVAPRGDGTTLPGPCDDEPDPHQPLPRPWLPRPLGLGRAAAHFDCGEWSVVGEGTTCAGPSAPESPAGAPASPISAGLAKKKTAETAASAAQGVAEGTALLRGAAVRGVQQCTRAAIWSAAAPRATVSTVLTAAEGPAAAPAAATAAAGLTSRARLCSVAAAWAVPEEALFDPAAVAAVAARAADASLRAAASAATASAVPIGVPSVSVVLVLRSARGGYVWATADGRSGDTETPAPGPPASLPSTSPTQSPSAPSPPSTTSASPVDAARWRVGGPRAWACRGPSRVEVAVWWCHEPCDRAQVTPSGGASGGEAGALRGTWALQLGGVVEVLLTALAR